MIRQHAALRGKGRSARSSGGGGGARNRVVVQPLRGAASIGCRPAVVGEASAAHASGCQLARWSNRPRAVGCACRATGGRRVDPPARAGRRADRLCAVHAGLCIFSTTRKNNPPSCRQKTNSSSRCGRGTTSTRLWCVCDPRGGGRSGGRSRDFVVSSVFRLIPYCCCCNAEPP